MKKHHSKYTSDIPRRLYTFFLNYDGPGVPSFSKFARSIGATLSDVERFREKSEFEMAYQECSEIRRDYLIDNGLVKRHKKRPLFRGSKIGTVKKCCFLRFYG